MEIASLVTDKESHQNVTGSHGGFTTNLSIILIINGVKLYFITQERISFDTLHKV